jgi:hypothetical protein
MRDAASPSRRNRARAPGIAATAGCSVLIATGFDDRRFHR